MNTGMNDGGPPPAPSDDALMAEVRRAYRTHDPVPDGLVPRIQAALAMAGSDVDAELMELVEQGSELVGTRAAATAYTLRFEHDGTELMLRIAVEDAESRIDGWVAPAEPMTVTAIVDDQDAGSGPVVVSETGRFELTGVPRGLVRLRLEPHDPARPAFLTPAFEV